MIPLHNSHRWQLIQWYWYWMMRGAEHTHTTEEKKLHDKKKTCASSIRRDSKQYVDVHNTHQVRLWIAALYEPWVHAPSDLHYTRILLPFVKRNATREHRPTLYSHFTHSQKCESSQCIAYMLTPTKLKLVSRRTQSGNDWIVNINSFLYAIAYWRRRNQCRLIAMQLMNVLRFVHATQRDEM